MIESHNFSWKLYYYEDNAHIRVFSGHTWLTFSLYRGITQWRVGGSRNQSGKKNRVADANKVADASKVVGQ